MSLIKLGITELSWLTVQLNPLETDISVEFKSLKDLCLEKLVSDMFLHKDLIGIPKTIYSMLLSTAFAQNRFLSVSQLMDYCPYKELQLPIPAALKHWQSLMKPETVISSEIEMLRKNAITMLSTFISIIMNNCKTSQLEVLDLGIVPWDSEVFNILHKFICSKDPTKGKYSEPYTLKISIALNVKEDADVLLNILNEIEAHGLRLVMTGLLCYNDVFPETLMLEIIEKLLPSEFAHFSLSYANIYPSPLSFLTKLQNFKKLKYLNLCYHGMDFSFQPHLNTLASTLNALPQLSRLILTGNALPGGLNVILQKYCKKNSAPAKKIKSEHNHCCIVHNGNLEFLNISAARLLNDDILFLREMSLTRNLKYLNVGYNSLNGLSGFDSLLALKSSLILLDMESAFPGRPSFKAALFPFSTFTQLKYLNIKGIDFKLLENFQQFAAEKSRVPDLIIHAEVLDEPPQ